MNIINEIQETEAFKNLKPFIKSIAIRKETRESVRHALNLCNCLGGFEEYKKTGLITTKWLGSIIEEIYNKRKTPHEFL